MRLGLLAAMAMLGLGMLPATAAADYQLCIHVMNTDPRGFNIQVGAGSYIGIGAGQCATFNTFGPIRARIGGDPIVECNGADVAANNTAMVRLDVGYTYTMENRSNPYQASSCNRTQ